MVKMSCCVGWWQALRLKEIERRLIEDTRRRKHDWERDVEKMREEFLTLHPCDVSYISDIDDHTSARRRSSTDVFDSKQMKTMILEYPDAGKALSASHSPSLSQAV